MPLAFEQPGPRVKRFSLMTKSREKRFQKKGNRPSCLSGWLFSGTQLKITNYSMLYFITYYADSVNVMRVLLVNVHLQIIKNKPLLL